MRAVSATTADWLLRCVRARVVHVVASCSGVQYFSTSCRRDSHRAPHNSGSSGQTVLQNRIVVVCRHIVEFVLLVVGQRPPNHHPVSCAFDRHCSTYPLVADGCARRGSPCCDCDRPDRCVVSSHSFPYWRCCAWQVLPHAVVGGLGGSDPRRRVFLICSASSFVQRY